MTNQKLADLLGVKVCNVYAWKRGDQKISRYNKIILDLINQGVDIESLTFSTSEWWDLRQGKTRKATAEITGLDPYTVRRIDKMTRITRQY
jgi:hypothetical protein